MWYGPRIKCIATVVDHLYLGRRDYKLGQVLESALVGDSRIELGLVASLPCLEVSCLALSNLA